MPSTIDAFAAPAAPVKVEHTYTETHPTVIDGTVSLTGVQRDSDKASFVRKTTGTGDTAKSRYIAAGTVARYLQLLAALSAPATRAELDAEIVRLTEQRDALKK